MRVLVAIWLLIWPVAVVAQDDQSDRGFVQGLLEDALSGAGRSVRVEGFAGALSSRATIDRITVSDPDGVWLSLTDVSMVWTRTALARGRIEIDDISIGLVDLPRLPVPVEDTPAPEASGSGAFALPDLPVALNLAQLTVARVVLGEPLFGEAAEVAVVGSAALEGGEGEADLAVTRLDKGGALTLAGAYANATRDLTLNLDLSEPEDGIAANLLGLPGRPSVVFTVVGQGPVDDFAAALTLETDGSPRLAGDITLRGASDGAQRFALDIGGDIAPVFLPEYRAFLGEDVQLSADASRAADGAITLNDLALTAQALSLRGDAAIGGDGWPERLALTGRIAPTEGSEVLLPLGGERTFVQSVDLTAGFDAARGDAWQLNAQVAGLRRADLSLRALDFTGTGQIARAQTQVTGALDLDLTGLVFVDEALARATGPSLRGALAFEWQQGAPLRLDGIDLAGADYGLAGALVLDGLTGDGALTLRPDLTVDARDLSRFAALSGVDLTGAAALDVSGRAEPLSGAFDLRLAGRTANLTTGIAQVDPLLAGPGTLSAAMLRDGTGLRADPIRISTQAADISGELALASGASRADVTLAITDTALVLEGLSGPSQVVLKAEQTGQVWSVDADARLPQTEARYLGTVTLPEAGGALLSGDVTARAGRLEAFSRLAGRDLLGAITLEGRIAGDPAGAIAVSANGTAQDLVVSVPQLDPLMRGRSDILLRADRDAAGTLTLERLSLINDAVELAADGVLAETDSRADVTLGLVRPGLAVPGLPGPATARFNARQQDASLWRIDADARLPQTSVSYLGTLTLPEAGGVQLAGRALAEAGQLSIFSQLAGRGLSGAARISAEVDGDPAGDITLSAEGSVTSLGLGMATLDPLLRGTTQLALSAARRQDVLQITRLSVDGVQITGDARGVVGPDAADVRFDAALANLALLVPDLPGRAAVQGRASHQGGPWRVDVTGDGPGGIGVAVNGTAAQDFGRLDLGITGAAPLALLNQRLNGQSIDGTARFNLALNGAPALSALSGRLGLENARLALPAQRLTLEEIIGGATLSGGRAQIDLGAELSSGGNVALTGPVTLEAPFNADLAVVLRAARLSDPALYETTADGRVTVVGPLTGGARIGGAIDLGRVELRVPNIGPSYTALDGLEHENMPADVRRTLQFAGMTARQQAQGGAGPSYPIDLAIRAPARIFVRGRGLDAELGGGLRLTGTTSDLVPVGQFDLVRGRLDLLGRRLNLTEGAVRLRGSFDPYLRFVATSRVEDVDVRIEIEGIASAPELRVTSQPELPQDQALSLLLFGRDITQLSALQVVQLASAIRTLSGRGGLGIAEQLRNNIGVDDLDVGTDADGNAQARVGKYISDNIYTDVTVNSQGDSEINLNLDLTPNVTLRGRVGSDGDSGIGLFFEKDY